MHNKNKSKYINVYHWTTTSHVTQCTWSHLDKLGLWVFLCWFHLQPGLQTLLQHRPGHRSTAFLRHYSSGSNFLSSLTSLIYTLNIKQWCRRTRTNKPNLKHQQTEQHRLMKWQKSSMNDKNLKKTHHATHFRINVNWSCLKILKTAHCFRSLHFLFDWLCVFIKGYTQVNLYLYPNTEKHTLENCVWVKIEN